MCQATNNRQQPSQSRRETLGSKVTGRSTRVPLATRQPNSRSASRLDCQNQFLAAVPITHLSPIGSSTPAPRIQHHESTPRLVQTQSIQSPKVQHPILTPSAKGSAEVSRIPTRWIAARGATAFSAAKNDQGAFATDGPTSQRETTRCVRKHPLSPLV